MRRTIALACLMLAATACGDDTADTSAPGTTAPVTVPTTTETIPSTEGTLTLEAAGETWDVPAAACLLTPEDERITFAVAEAAAEEVRSLVAERSSGWPTTSAGTEASEAEFERASHRAGVIALALSERVERQDEIVSEWEAFEQSYADADQGFPAVSAISRRLEERRTDASALLAVIGEICP